MQRATTTNADDRRRSVMRWIGAPLALLLVLGAVLPVSAAVGDVAVSITVTAGGVPLDGATVTLTREGIAVPASAVGGGVYTADVVEGTYALSIDPPAASPYERYEDPAFEVSGTTVTTIALFLPTTDPDPDPDPDPDTDVGTVKGSVRNGLGFPGAGLTVSLVNGGVTVDVATTDADGSYSVAAPPGEWQLRVLRSFTPVAPAGWPNYFDVTYRNPVSVVTGSEVTRDVVLSFVEQTVSVLRPDGQPAAGFGVIVRVNPASFELPGGSELSSIYTQDGASTSTDGEVRLLVLQGVLGRDGYVRADGGGTFNSVFVRSDVITGSLPTTDPIVAQFADSRTVTGQLRDAYGPVRGLVSIRSQSGTTGGTVDTGADGNFTLLFPSAPGPYVLTGRDPQTNLSWRFETTALDDETSDVGVVTVPQTRVDLCVVDEVDASRAVVPVTLTIAGSTLRDVPVGTPGLTADFTFATRSVSNNSGRFPGCAEAVMLFDATDVDVTLAPDPYSAYYRTASTVDTRLASTRAVLRLGRFDQLSDSVAVDVDLRLVNGLGLGLGELPVNMLHSGVTYSRLQVTDQDGRVDVRLARGAYDLREIRGGRARYPTARGFTSATGGASPDGRYDVRLALGNVAADVSRYDLGTVVLPFVPVDVSVRGSASQPLVGTVLETPRVQSCASGDDVMIEVCASSAYSATTGLRIPGVTNQFGRERLWLVPGVHQLTVTPTAADLAAGYQVQTVTVTVPVGGRGQSVFVVLQNPSGAVDPDPSPQVSVGGPYTVAAGETVQLDATVLIGEPVDDAWAWDLDDDGVFESPGRSVTFDASDEIASATPTVRVRACDAQGRCAQDASTITVVQAGSIDPDVDTPDPVDPVDPVNPVEPDPVEPDPVVPDPVVPDARSGRARSGRARSGRARRDGSEPAAARSAGWH
jgi:hypothetical protein